MNVERFGEIEVTVEIDTVEELKAIDESAGFIEAD